MTITSVYLESSDAALESITRLYDFLWPTAASLWNLRWQVNGYATVRGGTVTDDELQARFVVGSGIYGANLHRACLQSTWTDQQERLAEVLLVNLVAIHECWLDATLAELRVKGNVAKRILDGLAFPTALGNGGVVRGIGPALLTIGTPPSEVFEHDIYPVAAMRPRVHTTHLEQMMLVYRYFKELRNCLMHAGGRAD